jgi:hypothetical protein
MIDLNQQANAFERLNDFVVGEPRLAEFRAAVAALLEQARALARGARDIELFTGERQGTIPDEALARKVVQLLSDGPPLDGDEDAGLVRALGVFQANIAVGVFHAVWRYPRVVPRRPRRGHRA